jgi:glycosyltransferase involved in cell wall biosynthesis
MVANWGEFKRHWDFFVALRGMPKSLRVVLVGQREGGRDAEFISKLARQLGVPQRLEIHQSIPIEAVNRIQEDSKVSLIFSRREGCCVAAVESLFAGCALGMRNDAHVGPLEYITPETGLRLRPRHLAEDLLTLLELSGRLDPAAWAMAHLSCDVTHKKVNDNLLQSSRRRGLPWTRDVAVPYWFPYPRHLHEADAESLRPAYAEMHGRFPKVVAADLIERGHR